MKTIKGINSVSYHIYTMDSRTILKTFNDHFEEFVNDVVNMPDNKDVLTTRTALTTIRKANPKLIIKCWKEYVSIHTHVRSRKATWVLH